MNAERVSQNRDKRTRHADMAGEESQTGKIQTEKEGEIGKGRVR